MKYALWSPVYWVLMSVGAWKALIQLFTKPSYWEKTEHGFCRFEDQADVPRTTDGAGPGRHPDGVLSGETAWPSITLPYLQSHQDTPTPPEVKVTAGRLLAAGAGPPAHPSPPWW